MAISVGTFAVVSITGAGNANCVLNARKMNLRIESDTQDVTSFTAGTAINFKKWLPTKRRALLTVDGWLDGTSAPTAFDAEITIGIRTAGACTVDFGATTGWPRFTFSGFVTLRLASVVDGVNNYTATIRSTGAITGTTIP